ncbi:hypothetical protein KNT91_gp183 [Aeromonas phage 60AhydR15PP]|uniref:Uncharacterized protein n=1 Tax=Aeromonas phage 60AhydR15PP TaxID=2163979 RepID=A0A2S1PGL9_9CAUD|nr:hypothetical protein KNT91_gp183 [Aeromonas phage 60AhydR15PP]AWH15707.1 hypothetical protein [Aeromonas phage 60AhydR15PP]
MLDIMALLDKGELKMTNDQHVKATIKRLEYKSALYRCRAMGLKFPGTEICEFISIEAYNDWLNREDDDGLMKYDGKFDPTHPFVVTVKQAGSRKIYVDIIGEDGQPLVDCEYYAFVPEDFSLIRRV